MQCKICKRYFKNLGEINAHYRLARHPRQKRPPKKFKLDPDQYTKEDFEQAIALLDLLKNPKKLRARFREYIDKREYRRFKARGGR